MDILSNSASFYFDRSVIAFLHEREWIAEFNLVLVHQTQPETVPTSLASLLTEYSDLFDTSTLPPIKGFKAHLHIKINFNFKLSNLDLCHMLSNPK